jgi:hypothetical protein
MHWNQYASPAQQKEWSRIQAELRAKEVSPHLRFTIPLTQYRPESTALIGKMSQLVYPLPHWQWT